MSYFNENEIQNINIKSDKPHHDYVEPIYMDDPICMKHTRNVYKTSVNNWLDDPLIHSYGIVYRENGFEFEVEEDEDEVEDNDEEVEEDKDAKDNDITNDIDDMYEEEDDITNDMYDDFPDDSYIKVSEVCLTMYKEILNEIIKSGFEIEDINQFKEDFIHYMYKLSNINTRQLIKDRQ
jgi:hypothetical protein